MFSLFTNTTDGTAKQVQLILCLHQLPSSESSPDHLMCSHDRRELHTAIELVQPPCTATRHSPGIGDEKWDKIRLRYVLMARAQVRVRA